MKFATKKSLRKLRNLITRLAIHLILAAYAVIIFMAIFGLFQYFLS